MMRTGRTPVSAVVCLLVCCWAFAVAAAQDLLVDSEQRLGNEASWAVALGDVDGDGDLDAVVANLDAGAIVWLNDGTGHFTDFGQRLAIGAYLALADLDGDGALDIVFGSPDQPVTVWWNDGSGTFVQGETPLAPAGCSALGVGDLSGDGRQDIFVGMRDADLVLFNMGDRTFADSGQRFGSAPTGGVALGDMDGDGDLDVVTAGWDEPGHVWQNDGTGTLTALCELATTTLHVHGIAVGDVDADGDLDVFFALAGGICCRNIWLNDGTGKLTPRGSNVGAPDNQGIAVGDLNLDGRLDIVLANGMVSPLSSTVRLGQEAWFVDSGLRMGSAFAGGVALGDLDGDGDLDLFIAFLSLVGPPYVQNPHPNEVWFNTTNE